MSQRSTIWPRTMIWMSTSLVRMPCASLTKMAICCHLKIRQELGSGSGQVFWSVFLRNWAAGLRQFIWGFPKIGVPLVIIHSNGIFPYKPSIWGYPHLWKPPYVPPYLGGLAGFSPRKIWLFSNCTSQVGTRLHACEFHERAGDLPGIWELNRAVPWWNLRISLNYLNLKGFWFWWCFMMFHVHVSCAEAFDDKKGVEHLVVIVIISTTCRPKQVIRTVTTSDFFQVEAKRIFSKECSGRENTVHKQYQQP